VSDILLTLPLRAWWDINIEVLIGYQIPSRPTTRQWRRNDKAGISGIEIKYKLRSWWTHNHWVWW
jgi:hypothetical protein